MAKIALEVACSEAPPPAGTPAFPAILALRRGDRARAESLYATIATQMARDVRCLVDLAAYALLSGRPQEARRFADEALRSAPDHVEALINRSVAAFGLNDPAAALALAGQAVRASPDHPQALVNFGLLQEVGGQPASAAESLARAVAVRPGAWRARVDLARILFALGRLADSRRQLLDALPLAARELPAAMAPESPPSGFPVGGARAALVAAKDVLDAAGIPFFLVAGTLLGIVRDGDLLAHDKDMDIAVDAGVVPGALLDAFRGHPDFDPRLRLPPELVGTPPWALAVPHLPSRASIDIFGMVRERDGLLQGMDCGGGKLASRVAVRGFAPIQWQGRAWLAPDPVEDYLAALYGPGWRHADPYFDTVVSNPSRLPESLPIAIGLGLIRLGTALRSRKWARALALCEQLLAHGPVTELAALRDALVSRGVALQR